MNKVWCLYSSGDEAVWKLTQQKWIYALIVVGGKLVQILYRGLYDISISYKNPNT